MKIALMVEGQNGLNWERWKRVTLLAEDYGFDGVLRVDIFTNYFFQDMDSIE